MPLVVNKARRPPPPKVRGEYGLADSYVNSFSRSWVRTTTGMIDDHVMADMSHALLDGRINDAVEAIHWRDQLTSNQVDIITQVVERSGQRAINRLGWKARFKVRKQITTVPLNPYSIKWIQEHSAELIRHVTQTQKDTVRRIILDGFQAGLHPTTIAKQIRQTIGLLPREAAAVERRRQLSTSKGFPADKVESIAGRYAAQLRTKRAKRIARTELIRAQAKGQADAWVMAREAGQVAPEMKRKWISAPPSGNVDRPCSICLELADQPPVGLDEPWSSSFVGDVDAPPSHPNCRCVQTLVAVGDAEPEPPESFPQPEPEPAAPVLEIIADNRIAWVMGERQAAAQLTMVEIELGRLMEALKDSPNVLTKPIPGRLEALRRKLPKHGQATLDVPELSVFGGKVSVVDGRHRLALARELGDKTVMIAIDARDTDVLNLIMRKPVKPKVPVKTKPAPAPLPRKKTRAEWVKSMSADEKEAFKFWTGDWYSLIRQVSSDMPAPDPTDLKYANWKRAKRYHDRIIKAFKTAPEFDGQVFRGLVMPKEALAQFTAGKTFEPRALASFTETEKEARKFASGLTAKKKKGDVAVVLRVERVSTQAYSIAEKGIGNYNAEHEILIEKGKKFKITGQTRKGNVYYVDLEEIGGKPDLWD